MNINILLRTTDYRGDHAADACIAYTVNENETVQHLAERLLQDEMYIRAGAKVVEIRAVQP